MSNILSLNLSLRAASIWVSVLLLSSCGSGEYDDLREYMDEVARRPGGEIEPLPTFTTYEAFAYSAASMRSPFDRPVTEIRDVVVGGESGVKPNFSRPKEALENFNFASLSMVGTLGQEGKLWALVDDGDGGIHRISEGNYIGKNHGKVTSVESTVIEVLEIVPDGLDGWVARPRTLMLVEQGE